jgi:hypothetical protein
MNLKAEIENNVLDHNDRARVETDDMRCLCETIAVCFQALLDKLDELKESIDPDPRNPTYR